MEAFDANGRGHSKAWVRYAEERAVWREQVVEYVKGPQGRGTAMLGDEPEEE